MSQNAPRIQRQSKLADLGEKLMSVLLEHVVYIVLGITSLAGDIYLAFYVSNSDSNWLWYVLGVDLMMTIMVIVAMSRATSSGETAIFVQLAPIISFYYVFSVFPEKNRPSHDRYLAIALMSLDIAQIIRNLLRLLRVIRANNVCRKPTRMTAVATNRPASCNQRRKPQTNILVSLLKCPQMRSSNSKTLPSNDQDFKFATTDAGQLDPYSTTSHANRIPTKTRLQKRSLQQAKSRVWRLNDNMQNNDASSQGSDQNPGPNRGLRPSAPPAEIMDPNPGPEKALTPSAPPTEIMDPNPGPEKALAPTAPPTEIMDPNPGHIQNNEKLLPSYEEAINTPLSTFERMNLPLTYAPLMGAPLPTYDESQQLAGIQSQIENNLNGSSESIRNIQRQKFGYESTF